MYATRDIDSKNTLGNAKIKSYATQILRLILNRYLYYMITIDYNVMELILIIFYMLIGLITGFYSGIFGIGGASLRIPLLTMTGMPLINAFATNIFAIPFSSACGAYVQRHNIRWNIAKIFVIGGIAGIMVATFLVGIVSDKLLAIIFFMIAIVTVFALYLDTISPKLYNKIRPLPMNLFFGSFLVTLIMGMQGGSGGSLFSALLRAMHVKIHSAIAISLFAGIFTSSSALLIYFYRGEIVIIPAFIVAFTGMIGSYAGSKLSMCTDSKFLKIGLSIMVIFLASIVLLKYI